jgi:hypothetical protein
VEVEEELDELLEPEDDELLPDEGDDPLPDFAFDVDVDVDVLVVVVGIVSCGPKLTGGALPVVVTVLAVPQPPSKSPATPATANRTRRLNIPLSTVKSGTALQAWRQKPCNPLIVG